MGSTLSTVAPAPRTSQKATSPSATESRQLPFIGRSGNQASQQELQTRHPPRTTEGSNTILAVAGSPSTNGLSSSSSSSSPSRTFSLPASSMRTQSSQGNRRTSNEDAAGSSTSSSLPPATQRSSSTSNVAMGPPLTTPIHHPMGMQWVRASAASPNITFLGARRQREATSGAPVAALSSLSTPQSSSSPPASSTPAVAGQQHGAQPSPLFTPNSLMLGSSSSSSSSSTSASGSASISNTGSASESTSTSASSATPPTRARNSRQRTMQTDKVVQAVLSRNQLSEIPPEIFYHINLQQLDLTHNVIRELPPEIRRLTNLRRLACGNNEITHVPPEIGDLKNLTWLDFTHNRITDVSPRLGELQNLSGLGLSDCRLSEFPECIGRLSKVLKLGIFNNMIRRLPPSIEGLVKLVKLDVSNNLLQHVPPEIGKLKCLTWLNLSYNNLETLPDEIGELVQLAELGLGHNRLKRLPDLGNLKELKMLPLYSNRLEELGSWIGGMVKMEKLDFSDNRLSSVPQEITFLTELTYLNLKRNNICELPHGLKALKKLEFFDTTENRLTHLPYDIVGLTKQSLKLFRAGRNPLLQTIPPVIYTAPSLLVTTANMILRSMHNGEAVPSERAIDRFLPVELQEFLLNPTWTCAVCDAPFVGDGVSFIDFDNVLDLRQIPLMRQICRYECLTHHRTAASRAAGRDFSSSAVATATAITANGTTSITTPTTNNINNSNATAVATSAEMTGNRLLNNSALTQNNNLQTTTTLISNAHASNQRELSQATAQSSPPSLSAAVAASETEVVPPEYSEYLDRLLFAANQRTRRETARPDALSSPKFSSSSVKNRNDAAASDAKFPTSAGELSSVTFLILSGMSQEEPDGFSSSRSFEKQPMQCINNSTTHSSSSMGDNQQRSLQSCSFQSIHQRTPSTTAASKILNNGAQQGEGESRSSDSTCASSSSNSKLGSPSSLQGKSGVFDSAIGSNANPSSHESSKSPVFSPALQCDFDEPSSSHSGGVGRACDVFNATAPTAYSTPIYSHSPLVLIATRAGAEDDVNDGSAGSASSSSPLLSAREESLANRAKASAREEGDAKKAAASGSRTANGALMLESISGSGSLGLESIDDGRKNSDHEVVVAVHAPSLRPFSGERRIGNSASTSNSGSSGSGSGGCGNYIGRVSLEALSERSDNVPRSQMQGASAARCLQPSSVAGGSKVSAGQSDQSSAPQMTTYS